MLVSLSNAKNYLRVDSSDEDEFILQLINTAEKVVLDVSRLDAEEAKTYESLFQTAELYAIAYLYENREQAEHKDLTETLKQLLFAVRKEAF